MSVESSVSKVAFTGNNSTVTPYNVPFRIDNATDLVVVARLTATGVETTLAGGQFTVSGLGNPAGCTVTTAAAWPNTYTLTFYREVPATQLTTYASNDSFPAASHERALDKLTYLVQQALRKLGQCFRVTEASTTPTEQPSIPLSVLGLDGAGQLVFRSSQEMVSFLSLTAPLVDNPVATWQDAAERAVKVPDFLGQLGLERSTLKVYHSTGVAAGNWVASQADPTDLSVTTAKIITQAVTNGKLAHIASGTLKGRTSAGTGDVQDITVSQALDLIGSTRGQILFRGLSSWSSLVPGSANQILRSNGPSSDPDYISLSTLLPVGSVLQTVVAQTQVASSNTVVLPADSTVPQIGEGTLILSASITPSSATNKILVQVEVAGASSVIAVIALFRDANANAIAATQISSAAAGIGSMVINFQDTLSGTSTVTYTVRVGPGSAGTFFVNQSSSGNTLGGVHVSSIILKEIKG